MFKLNSSKISDILKYKDIRNECSDLAYNIIKDIKIKKHTFNERHLDKNDLNFEFENHFYNENTFPEISLNEDVDKFKDIMESNGFIEKTVVIEEKAMSFYENVKNPDIKVIDNKIVCEKTFSDGIDTLVNEGLTDFLWGKSRYNSRLETFSSIMRPNNIPVVSFFDMFEESFVKEFSAVADAYARSNYILRTDNMVRDFIISVIVKNYRTMKDGVENKPIFYTEIPMNGYFVPSLILFNVNPETKKYEFVGIYSFGTYERDKKTFVVPMEIYWSSNKKDNRSLVIKARDKWGAIYFE